MYLTHWARVVREHVALTIHDFHGPPRRLVERAAVEIRRGRRERRPHDEIWCVFDIDEHHGLDEAMRAAEGAGIHVAMSGPCIELWFLLHIREQTAWIDRRDVQARVSEELGVTKSLPLPALDTLVAQYPVARDRARRLDAMHEANGTVRPWNPSSTVWRLIDAAQGTPRAT